MQITGPEYCKAYERVFIELRRIAQDYGYGGSLGCRLWGLVLASSHFCDGIGGDGLGLGRGELWGAREDAAWILERLERGGFGDLPEAARQRLQRRVRNFLGNVLIW